MYLVARSIPAKCKVVVAVSPTPYATYDGAAVLQVHAGDTVTKGQVLVVIDNPELRNKLAQAQAQSNAEAMQVAAQTTHSSLQKADADAGIDDKGVVMLDRTQKAFAASAANSVDVDQGKDALEKARAVLSHAKRDMSLSDESLRLHFQAKKLAHENQPLVVQDPQRPVVDLNGHSPASGQVSQLFVAPCPTVAEDTKLLSVIDLSALQMQLEVPESFARDLGSGGRKRALGAFGTAAALVGGVGAGAVPWLPGLGDLLLRRYRARGMTWNTRERCGRRAEPADHQPRSHRRSQGGPARRGSGHV
jgi:HlyD family secretion protein